MKLNKSWIPYIVILILLLIICFCGFMWNKTADKLNKKEAELIHANATIEALQQDNNKLNEYNNQKNEQIKEIEKKYKEKVKDIPADSCGDVKPSKQLLEYFRKNV